MTITEEQMQNWLALIIGNSHLHWGWFEHMTLKQSWNTLHLSTEEVNCLLQHQFDFSQCNSLANLSIDRPPLSPPLWIASVVPSQTQLWQGYEETHLLSLNHVPLTGLYPTLGIDRALSLWGAATSLGLPALVIDAGTALTFSGADATGRFVGGAILPGLGLQLRSLTEHTAALPLLCDRLETLRSDTSTPSHWATNTPDAMIGGVLHTLLAGIDRFVQSWRESYPDSTIAFTGGDGQLLYHYWQQQYPQRSQKIKFDPHLMFWGMRSIVHQSMFRT